MPPAAEYDLFVSYAHADSASVLPLVRALRAEGLRVWLDESQVEDFASITRSIVHGLGRSKALLAFYSATYPTRRPCQWELTAAFLAAQHEGDPRRRVLVVNPEPGTGHLQPVELEDARFRAAPKPEDAAAAADLARSIGRHLAKLDGPLGAIRALEPPRWLGASPAGSNRFVGRLRELWDLHSRLQAPEAAIVTGAAGPALAQVRGLGGIGKSLLVEEYALRFGAAYRGGVFWLRAYGNDDAKAALSEAERAAERDGQVRGFAAELGIAVEGLDARGIRGALAARIARDGEPCLWVVDDLPSGLEAEAFRAWLAPHPLARTVLTTRSRTYDAFGSPLSLEVLEPEDAYRLLTVRRPPADAAEERAARDIVAALGRHALAVDVCGASVRSASSERPYRAFLEDLADPGEDILELAAEVGEALPTGHEKSIATTLLRSVGRLGDEGRDLLRLASVVAAAPLPGALVRAVFLRVNGLEEKPARRRADLAYDQVDGLSLAEAVGEDGSARTFHTLVTRTVRFRDPEPERRETLRAAAVAALEETLRAAVDRRTHGRLAVDVAHARELTRDAETLTELDLLMRLARHDYEAAAYTSAEALFRQEGDTRRRVLGDEHPDTLTSINNLAETLRAQGDLAGARKIQEEVLDTCRRVLGDEHPGTLTAMGNLALTLRGQGDLAGARKIHEEVLDTRRRVLGDEHPSTLTSMSNLAETLRAQGDLAGARKIYEEVLDIRRRVLDDEHPDTLTSINNLAVTLCAQGDLTGARKIQDEVLGICRRVLGDEHPDTLTSMNNLATTLRAQGNLADARKIHQEVLGARRRVLGDEHPDTLASMNNLATTLHAQGDLDGARKIEEKVLDTRRRTLGDQHPGTTVSAWNLFYTVRELGDGAAAARVRERDLAWLLERHPESLAGDQRTVRELLIRATGGGPSGE